MSAVDIAAPSTGTIWDRFVADLPVGVLLENERGEVIAANDRAARLLGLSYHDLITARRPPEWELLDDSGAPLPHPAQIADQVLRIGAPLTIPVVVTRNRVPLTRLWAEHHPVQSLSQQRILVLLQPVDTDVPHSRGLLDPLTGLPNRALLLDRLEQALTRARTLGTLATLVLVDIRRMAAVNIEHGFAQGDQLLVTLAERLRQGMRADHTVARYSGDTFAVVAEHPGGTGQAIADRVEEIAGRPLRLGRRWFRPALRTAWCTSDGQASVMSVLTKAEEQLARC
ncbi:MAG TPA: PAS domain-containing protein [Pseudonocardiaceae bacterium]